MAIKLVLSTLTRKLAILHLVLFSLDVDVVQNTIKCLHLACPAAGGGCLILLESNSLGQQGLSKGKCGWLG